MASPIIIPFDNNPTGTSIKTTSYTIPAGKYAYVQSIAKDVSVDGVVAAQLFVSASRVLSTSNQFYDYITANDLSPSDHFASMVISSTASSSLNYVNVYAARRYGTENASGLSLASSYGYSSNASFVGTRNIYFDHFVNVTSRENIAINAYAPMINAGGMAVLIGRTSGTVSYSISIYSSTGKSFWAPSGTVLAGTKYMVTEYNQIS